MWKLSRIKKLESFAHFEKNKEQIKNRNRLKKAIEKGYNPIAKDSKIEYVKNDKSFPKTIQKNKKKYKLLIVV